MNIIIPEIMLNKLRKLLKDVTELLDKNNINYWIDGGSLLGAVREGGQILHDDDCDIAIMDSEKKKIIKIIPKIKDIGYDCRFVNDMIKIFYKNEDALRCKIGDYCINYATLDIFFYKITNSKKVVLKSHVQRLKWPGAVHNESDLYPLKLYKFDGFVVWGPNNPIPYLDSLYGDWKNPKHDLDKEFLKYE